MPEAFVFPVMLVRNPPAALACTIIFAPAIGLPAQSLTIPVANFGLGVIFGKDGGMGSGTPFIASFRSLTRIVFGPLTSGRTLFVLVFATKPARAIPRTRRLWLSWSSQTPMTVVFVFSLVAAK